MYHRADEKRSERTWHDEGRGAGHGRRAASAPGKRTRTERLALWSAATSPGIALGPRPAEADHQALPAEQAPPTDEGERDRMAGWGSPLGPLAGASGQQQSAAAQVEDPEAIVAEQLAGGDCAAAATASAAAGQPQPHGGAGGRGRERKMALDVPPPMGSGLSRLSGEAVTPQHADEIELGDFGPAIAGEQRAISLELPRPAHVPERDASRREEAGASAAEKHDCIHSLFELAGSNVMGMLDSLEEQRQVQQQSLTAVVEAACEQIAGDGRQQIEAAYDRLEGEIDIRLEEAEQRIQATADRMLARTGAIEAAHGQARAAEFTRMDAIVVGMAAMTDPVVATLVDLAQQVDESAQAYKERSRQFREGKEAACAAGPDAGRVPKASAMQPPQMDAARKALSAEVGALLARKASGEFDHQVDAVLPPLARAVRAQATALAWKIILPVQSQLAESNARHCAAAAKDLARSGRISTGAVSDLRAAALGQLRFAARRQKERIKQERAAALARFDQQVAGLAREVRLVGRSGSARIDGAARSGSDQIRRRWEALRERVAAAAYLPRGSDRALQQIERCREDLQAAHEAHLAEIEEVQASAAAEVAVAAAQRATALGRAAAEQVGQIDQVRAGVLEALKRAEFTAGERMQSVAASFDEAAALGSSHIAQTAEELPEQARGLIEQSAAALRAELELQHAALREELDIAFGELELRVASGLAQAMAAKVAEIEDRTHELRGAITQLGTDEELIHATFRGLSWAEIDYLHAYYQGRFRSGDCDWPSTLAYDIDDEMSGRERDIALAYLGHARKVALKLDIEEAFGFWLDTGRVRDVIEAANKEEREALAASKQIAVVRAVAHTTQRDLIDTLLDTRLDEEERAARVAAIDLFDAMEGGGTDEPAIERVLGQADSEEERQRIHDAFEAYAGERGWNQTLDEALEDDLSGSELVLMKELARVERDESAVAIARLVRAADDLAPPRVDSQFPILGNPGWNGRLRALGHAQKRTILAALDDEGFAAQIRQAQAGPNPSQAVAALREQRKRQLGQALSRATGGAHDDIEQFLDQELGPSDVTYREICSGVTRDGVTITPDMIRAGKVPGGGYINLARMVAQVKIENGQAPRDLLVKCALDDQSSVDEVMLEQALSRGGAPLPQAELAALICTFRAHWGEDLVATEGEPGTTELDHLRRLPRAEAERRLKGSRAILSGERIIHFFSPGGKVEGEVDGRTWQRVRVLLCGKPRSPIESRYVALLEGHNAKSGDYDWLAGRAEEDLDRDIGKMEERYGALRGDQRTRSYGDLMLGARDGEAASSAWLRDTALGVKEGAEDVHTTAKIMAENKDEAVDKITMVGEIAAAIVVTLLSCGASLAVIGTSMALRAALAAKIAAAATATLGRRVALGEAYSGEEMARDIAASVVDIAITGAKVKLAVSASKSTSKLGVEIAKKVLEDQVEALPELIRSSGEEDRPGFGHNLAAVVGGALVERRLGNFAGEMSKQMIKSIDHDDQIDGTDLANSLIQDGATIVEMIR